MLKVSILKRSHLKTGIVPREVTISSLCTLFTKCALDDFEGGYQAKWKSWFKHLFITGLLLRRTVLCREL